MTLIRVHPRNGILFAFLHLLRCCSPIVILASSLLHAQVPPPTGIQIDTTFRQDSTSQKQPAGIDQNSAPTVPRNLSPDSDRDMREWMRTLNDTMNTPADTLNKSDSTRASALSADSTVRIVQWVHQRQDEPMVQFFPRENYPLYLDVKSPAFKRELILDSTGQLVTVTEKVNDLNVKVPITMPLSDYIHLRYEHEKINGWRSLASQYTMKQEKDDLSNLLSSLTNISIPVPANPLTNIFGGNEINLKISGGVDIRAAFRNMKSDQVAIAKFDQSRNEPDFNQNVQINVGGTIGKKLKIGADWNTQRTFEYENQLHIGYTGFEDEIIQSIEAGNVSLQTPSLVGGGQALFGIKAKLQTGPLMLTTLLSQKKGQSKEITVSGGATSQEREVYPYNYSKNHYFLDTLYAKFYEQLHSSAVREITNDIRGHQVLGIDIYLTSTGGMDVRSNKVKYCKAYIDLPPVRGNQLYGRSAIDSLNTQDGRYLEGDFVWLDPKEYTFNDYGGYINLLSQLTDDRGIAVVYTVAGTDSQETYGGYAVGDTTLYLKLIRPKNIFTSPNIKPAWDLVMKNFYDVGSRNLRKDGFEFSVWRRTEGTDIDALYGKRFLTVLGLDRFNQYGSPEPDNQFDFIGDITIDPKLGEVIFPTLRPFDSTIVQYFRTIGQIVPDSLLYHAIYDTTASAAQNDLVKNRYFMRVKATGDQRKSYPLGFNLVEGSVQVLLNGRPLTPKVDYSVDYIVGEVVILNSEALLPGANVQVKYEQNDLFSVASKTLMGFRGEIATFPNTNLGFTVMNLNQQTLSDKVRIGEEPTNNLMLGVDASTSANLPFLTDAIDALPFLRTREMSTIRFGGEAAYMIPDPNTKKSTIPGDNGASVAYLDDFEGARRTIPLPINYPAWTLASAPDSLMLYGMKDNEKNYYRSRLSWYNRLPTDVLTEDIWPNRKTRPGQNQVTVLNFDFDPNHRGVYNYSPNVDSTLHRKNIGENSGKYDRPDERRNNWNGVMRYTGSITTGMIEQHIAYIELWMQASSADIDDLRRGKLHIDLGSISEDVIPNGKLNTEDFMGGFPNGILNEGEDIGIDMLNNEDERRQYKDFLDSNSGDPDVNTSDPSADDYVFNNDWNHVEKFNGTEGNRLDAAGLYPNSEDLSGDNSLDRANQYVEYALPLDTVYYDSTGMLQPNEYRVGGGNKGWYQFRIPLLGNGIKVGGSSTVDIVNNMKFVRMWISGVAEPVNLRFAEINFVGNQWYERTKSDSLLKISVVNIEDNPEYLLDWYQLGIQREKDRTDPSQVIEANEQSLALILNDLPKDTSREVVKNYAGRPINIFNYKTMKMFVHGDQSFEYTSKNNYDAEIYLRFGSDINNYYEYRQPVHKGWDNANNEININFSQLTSVKAARPDTMKDFFSMPVSQGDSSKTYGVKGNPALTKIVEISIGIRNAGKPLLRGQVWVNELRLIDVDNSPGLAYRFDTQVKLADLGQMNFNYSQTDPNFHGLDQRFGDQTTRINWAMSASLALEKFFPQDWVGTSIPVSYSHSENLTKPKYLPNTDVVVTEAANKAAAKSASPDASKNVITQSQTLQVRDSYAVSNFRISPPSQVWYIRDTFSKLSFGFNYNTANDRDPSFVARTSWQWSVRVSYGVSISSDFYIQPFKKIFDGVFLLSEYKDWKLYYIPITNISASTGGQRSRSMEIPRSVGSGIRDTRNFGASKSAGFGWKFSEGGLANISGDYGLSIDRNLLGLDNDSVGRGFWSLMKSLFIGGQDSRYGQRFSMNFKPKIPNILDIPKYFDIGGSYGVNYAWQNTFTKGDLGKSAGFDNSISLSLTFRLKSLTDPWFEIKTQSAPAQQPPPPKIGQDKGKDGEVADSTKPKPAQEKVPAGPGSMAKLLTQIHLVTKYIFKIPFLDFETISINYAQTNHSGNPGVIGSTGFKNFWGRLPFQGSLIQYGPSRLYQLGLISDPHGTLQFAPKSSFPFISWRVNHGIRAPGGAGADQYTEGNNITLRTNRSLWSGASIDINWKVGWQYSKTTNFQTDAMGVPTFSEPIVGGSIERSFLTLPPVLFFKVFKSNLENVGKKYDQLTSPASMQNPGANSSAALAEAFEKGMEALPFLSKIIGQYVPRPNWTFRWDGIEKIAGLSTVFDRLSLEHNYSSTFRRDYRGLPGGSQRTDAERISYGFAPLAGVNMTFKQFLKGSLSGNFKYNSNTSYDLNFTSTNQNIGSTLAQEISLSLSYSRRGFSLPLFGLNLSNDVDITLTFSYTKNSRRRYDPKELSSNQDGMPQEGSTRTLLEPRIRYVLSSRVTAALFYRYTRTAPDATGSTIFGNTTNEAGVDIHISI